MKRPSDAYYRALPDRLGDQLTVSLLVLSIGLDSIAVEMDVSRL
jgi:hypothetical protein